MKLEGASKDGEKRKKKGKKIIRLSQQDKGKSRKKEVDLSKHLFEQIL